MKITLNIETNDPADLSRIAAALNGEAVTVTTTKPAASTSGKSGKSETSASAATGPSSGQASTPAATSQPSDNGPSATTAAVPTEADLIAAGNAAVAKVGVGGPDKVKKYIAEHFQKADGSPGTLKLTAENQRAKLLADLQAIGRGEIAL